MFLGLLHGGNPESERLYRWHIQERTGGKEPRSEKQSVDEYVLACRALLASMQREGFETDFPVVFGSNGRLHDGAHRIACGLALGKEVTVLVTEKPCRSGDWGKDWLVEHGISDADMQSVLTSWKALEDDARCYRDALCGRLAPA